MVPTRVLSRLNRTHLMVVRPALTPHRLHITISHLRLFHHAFTVNSLLAHHRGLLLHVTLHHRSSAPKRRHGPHTVHLRTCFRLHTRRPYLPLFDVRRGQLTNTHRIRGSNTTTRLSITFTTTRVRHGHTINVGHSLNLVNRHSHTGLPQHQSMVNTRVVHPTRQLPPHTGTSRRRRTHNRHRHPKPTPRTKTPQVIRHIRVALRHRNIFINRHTHQHFTRFPSRLHLHMDLNIHQVNLRPVTRHRLVTTAQLIVRRTRPNGDHLFLDKHQNSTLNIIRNTFPNMHNSNSHELTLRTSETHVVYFSATL